MFEQWLHLAIHKTVENLVETITKHYEKKNKQNSISNSQNAKK